MLVLLRSLRQNDNRLLLLPAHVVVVFFDPLLLLRFSVVKPRGQLQPCCATYF